jgi:hypothetical protein
MFPSLSSLQMSNVTEFYYLRYTSHSAQICWCACPSWTATFKTILILSLCLTRVLDFSCCVTAISVGCVDSASRVATRLLSRRSRVRNSVVARYFFFFSPTSSLALDPTQPPMHRVPGSFPGDKAAGASCWTFTSVNRRGLRMSRVCLYSLYRENFAWQGQSCDAAAVMAY